MKKESEEKMKVGNVALVDYSNGKKYDGDIVNVRDMPNGKTLFTVRYQKSGYDTVQYASLYLDKCLDIKLMEIE